MGSVPVTGFLQKERKVSQMKKLATFVLVLCLGAFTIGSVTGCGGKEEKKDAKDAAKDGAKDAAKDGAKDAAKDEKADGGT